uniref:TAXi_C domain-containing protein n=1 Tax=Heterorhabditis bacteriophora TaxID=37862 RepID=A0A1I7XIM9_HETBA
MSAQSRIQLEEAICNNMHRLTQQHFSSRLARLPTEISAKEVLQTLLSIRNIFTVNLACNSQNSRQLLQRGYQKSEKASVNVRSHFPSSVMVWAGITVSGNVSITRLVFEQGGDFFNLTLDDLEGFRTSTKTALETMANAALKSGVPLSTSSMKLPLRMSAAHFSIDAGIALLQANVDLYSSLYSYPTTNYS